MEYQKRVKYELKTMKPDDFYHKSYENGDYNLFFYKHPTEECEVKLRFYSKLPHDKIVGNSIYLRLLSSNIQSKINEFSTEILLYYLNNMLPQTIITVKGSRQNVIKDINKIFEFIQEFKPTHEAIQTARSELKKELTNTLEENTILFSLFNSFYNFISECPIIYEFVDLIDKADCEFYSEYNLEIQSQGFISESEIKSIYDMFKSTATYKLTDLNEIKEKELSYQTYDSNNNGYLASYEIKLDNHKNPKSVIKRLAIANLLKSIINNNFFSYFRSDLAIAYIAETNAVYFHKKSFLTFLIQSTVETNEIDKHLKAFINTIPQILKNIDDKQFEKVKTSCYNLFNIDTTKPQDVPVIWNFANIFRIYDSNIIQKYANSLKGITKQEVEEYLKSFKNEPIVLKANKK